VSWRQVSWRLVKQLLRYVDFSCFQMAAVAILDLLCTTKESLVVFINVLKLGRNRCNGFDNVQVLIFCKFGLKMISNAPKIGSLEGCDPINVLQSHCDP